MFNVRNSNNMFYFKKSITNEEGFIQITIPPSAYEIETLINEIKRIIINQGHYTEDEYPFKIKPFFSTLGSVIEKSPQGPKIGFVCDDSMRNLLGFHETILFKEYNLSPKPVDIISFDNIFIGTDIAKGMLFKGKRTGIIHNFTMNVNPVSIFVEHFSGGTNWYMKENKEVISSNPSKVKNENRNLVSFNGQSNTSRLSVKEP